MSEHNNENNKKAKSLVGKNKFDFLKAFKIFIISILIIGVIGGGALGGIVLSMIKSAPEIDPQKINSDLSQTSSILDIDGNLIEKIDTAEYRTFVSINQMPKHLWEAFVAIEDERFFEHNGIDPKGIVGSFFENIKADGIVRGASTITQQLVKNVYLSPEKKYSRKVQEAFLAVKLDKALSKEQILEAYLNRNFFGQNAYGVQEAAQTYFAKDVGDLTIAESAVLAGIIKSIQTFQPYYRVKPENFDATKHFQVGEADILGEKYILVFNEKSIDRQKIILKKMLDLGKINQNEYDEALAEDIKTSLKPGQRRTADITSYFTDFVKTEVINSLVLKQGYTKEEAEDLLFTGGLQIYSTVDVSIQQELEDIYSNFTKILVGNTSNVKGPILIDWRLNGSGNIIDDTGKTLFYKQSNLLNEDFNLIIEKGSFNILENGDIKIKNNKLNIYPTHVDIADYYRIDDRKNLVTHTIGSIVVPEGEFEISENKEFIIKKVYLDKYTDFYSTDSNGNLLINEKYFFRSKDGIVQPQSASVILDYKTGHIKAIIGGRDVDGNRVLNRATASQRQPGSAIKPIATYLPALDNGYTAGTALDDLPYFDKSGSLRPRNVYSGYKGMHTLRTAIEQSVNTIAVRTVENVGFRTSFSYLEKLGIINSDRPESDSIVTSSEDKAVNDENISALGLGGMTKGLTPLELTAAYGAIANNGVFIEPIAFTKVHDKEGNVIIDNTPKETMVVSPQVAYILKDILRTTVAESNTGAGNAKISGLAVAGKTGTTQNRADIWFVGFTPYYVSGVWIGNDSPKITISRSSGTAAEFWRYINNRVHSGLEKISSFKRPDGIISVNICTQSGLLPTELCQHDPRHVIKSEIFVKGTEPKTHCDIHVEAEIDITTGKLANEYCPLDSIESKVFIQRNPAYIPANNKNIVPSDWEYSIPTEICDKHDKNTVIVVPNPDEFDYPNINDKPEKDNDNNTGNDEGQGNKPNGNGNNGSQNGNGNNNQTGD